jgi:8-oxo-dGTP pyrophosphatase MutT (NUDIX family)
MSSELYTKLYEAVSPFEKGVKALKLRALHKPGGSLDRPKKTAAVLVPVIDKPNPEVILTVRSDRMPQHAGQVSFPGGAVDRKDRSAIATALREAEEEIGLDFSQVSPIGFLDRLDTNSDYRVLPVVGLIHPSFVWKPNDREVSDVFTMPLDIAVDRKAYSHQEFAYGGKTAVVSSLDWQGYRVWGVTAAILLNLGIRMSQIQER